ncbi:MAG: nickel-dependent hydrogenase large subunit [Candidatus Bathyarchaeia archaeon]
MKVKRTWLMTRVDGYSEIRAYSDGNRLLRVEFAAPRFRDFARILVGRRIEEIPRIVARLCGVCSLTHEVAACKALENALGVEPPETAKAVRLLMLMGEILRSHAIHFLVMNLPDLMSLVNPLKRMDLKGISEFRPKILRNGLEFIRCGERILEVTGGRAVQPVRPVVGGVTKPLTRRECDVLLSELKSSVNTAEWASELANSLVAEVEEKETFNFKEKFHYVSSLDLEGGQLFYGGDIMALDEECKFTERILPSDFYNRAVEVGWVGSETPNLPAPGKRGNYLLMTGPEARALLATRVKSTILLEKKAEISNTLLLTSIRLREAIFCLLKSIELLGRDTIAGSEVRTPWEPSEGLGTSVVEAPRGTLLHRYKINGEGLIDSAEIITPTSMKTPGINLVLCHILSACSKKALSESETLERIKMAVRMFDPCISCLTHASRIG